MSTICGDHFYLISFLPPHRLLWKHPGGNLYISSMEDCRFIDHQIQHEHIYRPFDNIPNELLAFILTWVFNTLGSDRERFRFPLTTPQLVSRRWRDITLTTPALWTTLQITTNLSYTSLEHYLERSGNMSLNLDIRDVGPHLVPVAHARRWAHVTLWIQDPKGADEILEKISPAATSLRHLSLILPQIHTRQTLSTRFGSLFPDLASLHLTNVLPDWGANPMCFKDLTQLVIRTKGIPREVKMEGLIGTLRASPRLRRLELFKFLIPEEDIGSCLINKDQCKSVELADLEELVLADFYITEFLFLVYQLDSPGLQSFGVGLMEYDDPLDQINTDIDWSACSPVYPHLQRLDLWSLDIDADHLHLAIRNIRPISYLAVRGPDAYHLDDHAKSFSQFNSSVRTLQTRNVGASLLRKLVREFFPKTERVYIYWRDMVGRTEGVGDVVGLENTDGKPREAILWGEEDGDDWYLEDEVEKVGRIRGLFV